MPTKHTTSSIRLKAEELLTQYAISQAPVPVEKLAQAYANVRYAPYEGELAGMLVRGESEVVIGVNSLHHTNRQRFTIAHELGHLFLHPREDVHIDRAILINRRDATSATATDIKEIEANRFAAEILMPYKFLIRDLHTIDVENEDHIQQLAKKYHVSLQAMVTRLSTIFRWGHMFGDAQT